MIEEYISEHRRTHFKASNQFSPAELRRRLEEAQNERRQQRREQILAGRHGKQYDGVIGHEGDTNVTNMGGDEVSAVPDTNTVSSTSAFWFLFSDIVAANLVHIVYQGASADTA